MKLFWRVKGTMITILDYGLGNVGSISRMIQKVGGKVFIANSISDILRSDKLILPGVGKFDYGMMQLRNHGFVDPIVEIAMKGKIIFGICLGMQLLCNSSEEGDGFGLGLIDADVKKLPHQNAAGEKCNIPNMGWSEISVLKDNMLFNTGNKSRFYFVHSYYVDLKCQNYSIATAKHSIDFCCSFQRGNILGVQFHPEKSHRYGVQLFKNFVAA
jgi:glutamine amidotransferase